MKEDQSASFNNILAEELKLLQELRNESEHVDLPVDKNDTEVYVKALNSHLTGLAFSGGGIRSATFNLGVIQALARHRMLGKFDYLSTVSGGGYIGGWLSALLHRLAGNNKQVDQRSVENLQRYLQSHPDTDRPDVHTFAPNSGFAPVEHKAARYLRRYSNYLTPKLGISGDMIAVIAIFLRNFVLIQLALITLLATLLLVIHLIGAYSMTYAAWLQGTQPWPTGFLTSPWSSLLASLPALFGIGLTGAFTSRRTKPRKMPGSGNHRIHLLVIVPTMISGWWLSVLMASSAMTLSASEDWFSGCLPWIWVSALAYALAWNAGIGLGHLNTDTDNLPRLADREQPSPWTLVSKILIALASGAIAGFLLHGCMVEMRDLGQVSIWHAAAFGPLLFALLSLFVITLHIGCLRRHLDEQDREWMARVGGFLLLYALTWSLLFSLILFGTPAVEWLAGGGLALLLTWLAGSGAGAWIAGGPGSDNGSDESLGKRLLTRMAPWLFVVGLVIVVSWLLQQMLFGGQKHALADANASFTELARYHLEQLTQLPLLPLLGYTGLAGLLFVLISLRLDINLFSLHAMYCNRLARAYLGASRAGGRTPNPFTGFDPQDDFLFSELARQRPFHIINTAINMTGGDDLAWQTRRAASFSFTPLWAGFETCSSQGFPLGKYRPTADYAGGRNLGTLMAVSGAAASPNMGYHTSPAVAALLTAFNLRLGRWCGNPARRSWKKVSPPFAAAPIIAELTGSANAQADWINLTDGGHFENLGVYELIRRRCRLIVVIDAGADANYLYEDLANMTRMCWTDFGVNVCFDDFSALRPGPDERTLSAHHVVGRIFYGKGLPEGRIVYIKASLTGSEWPDIRQYADKNKEFPHQSTADQFFDERQFEAYRHLGYKVAAVVLESLQAHMTQRADNILSGRKLAELTNAELVRAMEQGFS